MMSPPIAFCVSTLSFRAEENRPSVEVTLKDCARFAHRARMRQGEDLESARVREHERGPNS